MQYRSLLDQSGKEGYRLVARIGEFHDCEKRCIEVIRLRLFGVQHLNWVGTARDGEDGATEKVLGELFCVECGRCHNDLKVGPSLDSPCERHQPQLYWNTAITYSLADQTKHLL